VPRGTCNGRRRQRTSPQPGCLERLDEPNEYPRYRGECGGRGRRRDAGLARTRHCRAQCLAGSDRHLGESVPLGRGLAQPPGEGISALPGLRRWGDSPPAMGSQLAMRAWAAGLGSTGMEIAKPAQTRSSSSAAITIGIVDGDPLAREELRTRLAPEGDFEVIGEALDATSGIELVKDQRPDLVLIEEALPDLRGTETMAEMLALSPQTKVIMLAVAVDKGAQMEALLAGAAGYLPKSIDLELLPRGLRGVRAGEAAVTRALGTP